jgi:hypothetical protein
MKPVLFYIRILVVVLLVLSLSNCQEEGEEYVAPEDLEISEFTFLPEKPTSKTETQMLFYGCSYFQTTSIIIVDDEIDVRKHFNSRLKWPCVLLNDTIPLGKLKKGDYKVTLEIIDLNPLVPDSVFHTQTKLLSISNN